MDERFQEKRVWIVVGALGILFLCLMLCGLVTMAFSVMRSGTVYGVLPQAPAAPGAEGAVPPQVHFGPWGMGQLFGFVSYGVGLLLKLAFVGVLLLLFAGLIRRLFWGRRYCPPGYWGKPPEGKDWKHHPHPGWGPWARYWHGEPPEPRQEPASPEEEPEDPGLAYGGTE